MKELVCPNNSSGTSSPFMVTDCLWKLFKRSYIARQRVWENHSRGTKSPDKATGCLEKLLWTNGWKTKIVLKLAPSPQKEKHLPFLEIVVVLTKKREICPYKAGMKRLKWYNSSNSLLAATNVPSRWWNFSTIPAYDQISVLNLCRNWKTFTFARSDVQLQ